ncbi:hypothetical protein [Frankia gtarii]|uniref:hypothetical protein n=1 Tax=Frankia gtarii TaxID=2950102 RepID=UPI0021BF2EA8|nr:hypothetical protein [Frankia gtarii]
MPSDTIQLTLPGALVSVQAAQESGTLIADRSGWQRAVLRASMPSAAKLVACTLASHVAEAPEFLPVGAAVTGPGLVTLREETGYSRTHVQRQVSLLRRQGWLTTVARPAAGRTTRFALSIPDSMVQAGLVRLVESTEQAHGGADSAAEPSREPGRRQGRRSHAGSHRQGAPRRRTRATSTMGSETQDRAGGFVVDLVPSRDRGPFDPDAHQHPDAQHPDAHQGSEDRRHADYPILPTDAPVTPGEPGPGDAGAPAPHEAPAAPSNAAPGFGAYSSFADEVPADEVPAAAQRQKPADQAAAHQAPAEQPPAGGPTADEALADEALADGPPAPTVPLPPPPPEPIAFATSQVINVLGTAMRRPTSDFMKIFGKLQVIFEEDNWDPVTLALHLVRIIQTGVLVGDGDEVDNLSWRLDRLPRASTDCECSSCRERRAEQSKSPSAPAPRGRFTRSGGAGRGAGRPAATEPKRSEAAQSEAAQSAAPPVEIPRPPLEAIERAALVAREARLRERQQAADGAA